MSTNQCILLIFIQSALTQMHYLPSIASTKIVSDHIYLWYLIKFKEILTASQEKDNIFTSNTRQKLLGFAENKVKAKVKVNGKLKDIAVQRDVLGVHAAKLDQAK